MPWSPVCDTELSMNHDLGGVDSIREVRLHINGKALRRVPLRHESRCDVDSLSPAEYRMPLSLYYHR